MAAGKYPFGLFLNQRRTLSWRRAIASSWATAVVETARLNSAS